MYEKIWLEDPARFFVNYKWCVATGLNLIVDAIQPNLETNSDDSLATEWLEPVWESLRTYTSAATKIWANTHVSDYFDQSNGPYYLDLGSPQLERRVSGSCYHQLGAAIMDRFLGWVGQAISIGEASANLQSLCGSNVSWPARLEQVVEEIDHEYNRARVAFSRHRGVPGAQAIGKIPELETKVTAESASAPKKRRGRKLETDPKKDKRIFDGWHVSGCKSYEEYSKVCDLSPRAIKEAIDRHRKRLEMEAQMAGI